MFRSPFSFHDMGRPVGSFDEKRALRESARMQSYINQQAAFRSGRQESSQQSGTKMASVQPSAPAAEQPRAEGATVWGEAAVQTLRTRSNAVAAAEIQRIDESDPRILQYRQSNPKQGFLKLQMSTSQEAIPITNAVASIYVNIEGIRYLLMTERSDLSGITQPISLPAPDKQLTLDPKNPRPYSSYDLVVEHPDFKSVEITNIPIFDSITSLQKINMSPQGAELP